MLKIGLTGGIGSGKTIIGQFFRNIGIPIYNSDIAAKQLMLNNPLVIEQISQCFGKEAYFNNGGLNKKHLSQIIFNDKKALKSINSIVHPAVANDFRNWVSKQKSNYVIKEAAILFESGTYKKTDRTILVVSPISLKMNRIMKRDGLTTNEISLKIENQMPDNEKEKLADYVIRNNDNELLIPQVLQIHENLST